MTTKTSYNTRLFADMPLDERRDRIILLGGDLSKVQTSRDGWFHIYVSEKAPVEPTTQSYHGVTYHNFEAGVADLMSMQEPSWVAKTIPVTEMLHAHSEARNLGNRDQFGRMVGMLQDGMDYYDLKRLTKKQKDYCLDWIYANADKYGRNRHESAAIIIEILSGQRKAMGRVSGEAPYEPTLGSVDRSVRLLRWAASIFYRLGAPDMQNTHAAAVEVLRNSGAKLNHIEILRRTRLSLSTLTCSLAVKDFMKQLSEVLKRHGVTEVDIRTLLEDTKEAGTVRYGPHPIIYTLNAIEERAAWVRVNMAQLDMDSDEIEAFVEEVLARLTKRLKSRADRNK